VCHQRLVAGAGVRSLHDGAHLLQRHAEVAEPPDHLREPDLVRRVEPVAGRRVDLDPVEHIYVVVSTPNKITFW